jgi:small GTP-binding protein
MIQKKVCMLGGFAVGKTSLVARFVSSIFSEKYLSTVGVKVDKKPVSVDGRDVTLMIWDIYGQDEFQTIQHSQLRGMSGYLLVIDGTRRATLDTALRLHDLAVQAAGDVPFVVVINKADLESEWEIDDVAAFKLAERGWRVLKGSAKTGLGVEDAFQVLTRAMLAAAPQA